MEKIINDNSTVVKCDMTSCIYNSACCIVPCETKKENTHCNCDFIQIKTNDLTGDLQCCQWKWGNKPPQCVECQLYKYGEIVIPKNNIQFENVEEEFFND